MSPIAYFERVAATRFKATGHVSGAWNPVHQHIAPALGLLVHAVESDRDRRRSDGLGIGRLSYDILGTIPVDVVDIDARGPPPGQDRRAGRGHAVAQRPRRRPAPLLAGAAR